MLFRSGYFGNMSECNCKEELSGAELVLAVVEEQANDEGLWFDAETAPEVYLQWALRRLHEVIENELTPSTRL